MDPVAVTESVVLSPKQNVPAPRFEMIGVDGEELTITVVQAVSTQPLELPVTI